MNSISPEEARQLADRGIYEILLERAFDKIRKAAKNGFRSEFFALKNKKEIEYVRDKLREHGFSVEYTTFTYEHFNLNPALKRIEISW